jgi:hypothetical protein
VNILCMLTRTPFNTRQRLSRRMKMPGTAQIAWDRFAIARAKFLRRHLPCRMVKRVGGNMENGRER